LEFIFYRLSHLVVIFICHLRRPTPVRIELCTWLHFRTALLGLARSLADHRILQQKGKLRKKRTTKKAREKKMQGKNKGEKALL
jgi:heme exporter protein D